MSVMPAEWTDLSERASVGALPTRAQPRTDRRAGLKMARRSRQRWAVATGSVLVAFFAFTVAMLELLH
jgi:hypothetical protein